MSWVRLQLKDHNPNKKAHLLQQTVLDALQIKPVKTQVLGVHVPEPQI